MTKSIYDQLSQEDIDRLRGQDAGNVLEMMRHFTQNRDMDRALGYTNAVAAWRSGKSNVSYLSNHLAGLWLQVNAAKSMWASPEAPAREAPAPVPCTDGELFMVIVPTAQVDKMRRIFATMKWEILE